MSASFVLALAGSAAEVAAHTVGAKMKLAGLDSSGVAERLKGAQDCQMPAVARSRPSDSDLRRELASPHLGYLGMAVDIGADFEELRRRTGFDKVLDS